MIRVTVWNEFYHEKTEEKVKAVYPDGIHKAIADFLGKNDDIEVKTITLDDERKAAMVSNLLVVLCGNRDAQPIVNSGSLY